MRHWTFLRNNGLTICLLLLFAGSFFGQNLAGHREFNEREQEHGRTGISFAEYLTSGHAIEATFENWESEFLQMALYVWLTSFLYQRGSAESKDPESAELVDEDPRRHRNDPDVPFPVRRGGLLLKLYENSLVLVLFLMFATSFALHFQGSAKESCHEQRLRGLPCNSTIEHLTSSTFWFESFQNWQSEFLSIAVVVVFSIFLRQRGSPESKPVHAAHRSTGK